MKTSLKLILILTSLSVFAGCMLAQQLGLPTLITVQAFVHDPDGKPVEGATVHLVLPRYGGSGAKDQETSAQTNHDGYTSLSGTAHADYMVGVDKVGFYHTTGPHRGINTAPEFQKYTSGVQKIDLELRPIKNPIHSIGKFIDRLGIPAVDTPLGLDLEVGDWVAPYGKGKTGDFIFTVTGIYNTMFDYDQTLTLTFGNTGDGIILNKVTPRLGPEFKFPYDAPLVGYESRRAWRAAFDGKTRYSNAGIDDETSYIYRVRTQMDDLGNVRQALYGVITSEISLGGNNNVGRNVSFIYILNPDWSRNLEFFSGGKGLPVGKLPISPRPNQ